MTSNKDNLPARDPYDLLGVPFDASKAEISKAYRKLALKLHPDKQQKGNPALAEEIAKKFHDVKEARSFLLDDDHAEARRRFDAKRESDRLRQRTEALREKNMSERRKRLRDELKQKESLASKQKNREKDSRARKHEEDTLYQLRREGKRKRQEYAERDARTRAERTAPRNDRPNKTSETDALEQRQIRLKWDRKKMKTSSSEHSLLKLLSRFGSIEKVELLAKNGNQALVTFENPSSCNACVDFYADSVFMRAKYVGKRKQEVEYTKQGHRARQPTANESLEDRRMRQAVERERLLRDLKADEDHEHNSVSSSATRGNPSGSANNDNEPRKQNGGSLQKVSKFPLPLPGSLHRNEFSSIDALENSESRIFETLLRKEIVSSMQSRFAGSVITQS